MANIFDYVKMRGDLSLKADKFNEVDGLILSRVSYFPFEEVIKEDRETISKLSKKFANKNPKDMMILWDDDIEFFPLLGKSKRFGRMKITKYVNKISIEDEIQFSAVTIILPDKTIYVSFRGTDNTIVAWKENFNMCVKENVPSQIDAVKYLEEVAEEYPDRKIRIGGHSKGGNIAVYAAAFARDSVKNRIIKVYNNDGPGFNSNIIETEEYKDVLKKVDTFIPQDSIFGRLLNHQEKYIVIKSNRKGFMQHDLYSWQIRGKKMVRAKDIDDGSKVINKSIKQWFRKIDVKQREEVTDIMFEILYSANVDTFEELAQAWFTNARILFKSYKSLDAESKKMILETLSTLVKIVKDNFFHERKKSKNLKVQKTV